MKLNVKGMTCGHCERAITRAIARIGGTVRVDVAGGTVEVAGVDDPGRISAAIENEGYRVVGTPLVKPPAGKADSPVLDTNCSTSR